MIFAALQKLVPKHLLSRIAGWAAASEAPRIKRLLIDCFCRLYPVDLREAERSDKEEYASFNDFFTRALKQDARSIAGSVCSPADGTVAALGNINADTLVQSKNHTCSLEELLDDSEIDDYRAGSFITIYLAPHNYHRVHLACTGELHNAEYIPGSLFSVNQASADHLPGLFARNERLVCRFRTSKGAMTIVMVGAMLVGSIKPAWLDKPYRPGLRITTAMRRTFNQGEELGRFQMGSTVILLLSERQRFLVREGDPVRYGQPISMM